MKHKEYRVKNIKHRDKTCKWSFATKKAFLTTVEFDSNILNYQFGNSGENFKNISNFGKFLTFEPTVDNYATNLVVRTEKNYYIFLLTPVTQITGRTVPDMHIQVSVQGDKVIMTQGEVGSTVDNSIMFDLATFKTYQEKIAHLKLKTEILNKEDGSTYLNIIQNNLIVSIKNVINTKARSYLIFTLKNCSNQTYKISHFDLYAKKIKKNFFGKDNILFNRQADIVMEISPENIRPGETKTVVVGYSSFAVGDETMFDLTIKEKEGNRDIAIQFPPQLVFETL